jgi:competence protein ComEC
MAALALPFLAGNLVVHEMRMLPGGLFCSGLGFLAATAWACRRLRWPVFFAFGFIWTSLSASAVLGHRLDAALAGRDIEVAGWVDGFPEHSVARTVFSFRVDAADDARVPERLRLSWYSPQIEIAPGDAFELTVRLREPHGSVNPGGFDYERWLFLERFGATGYVRSGKTVEARGLGLARSALEIRAHLSERIFETVTDARAAAVIAALAIGDRSAFRDEDWRLFRRTGTSHLVAISGLHIGFVAALTFAVTLFLAHRWPGGSPRFDLELATCTAAVVAAGYAGLAGFSLPTQRALAMLVAALSAFASRRTTSQVNGLSLALMLVLILEPLSTLTASFWMSFAAVAVLLVGLDRGAVRRRVGSGVSAGARAVAAAVRLQCVLTFGLLPLVAGFFGEFSFVSALVNLVAIPLFGFVLVPVVLIAILLLAVAPQVDSLICWIGDALGIALRSLEWVASNELAAAAVPAPSRTAILVACLGVLLALPWHRLPGRRLAWIALLPLVLPARDDPGRGELRMTVLDVGHGLAVIVETASHRLLFDAGAVTRSGFDSGEEIVVPALRSDPHRGLDLILVSHSDNDHSGGVASVLASFSDADVIVGPDVDRFEASNCFRGERWDWDGVAFSFLHPDTAFPRRGNDSSCVLLIESPYGSVLIPGDIERAGERRLLAADNLHADVVIVPHHGSATSSSLAFTRAVSPSLALVSAGFRNRWGFPRGEVRQRWNDVGANMLVTGESGAIRVILTGRGMTVVQERILRRRYWHGDTVSGESQSGAL